MDKTERSKKRFIPSRRTIKKAFLWLLAISMVSVGLFWAAVFLIPLPHRLDAPVSVVINYDDGRRAHVFLAEDDRWRMNADHRQVDPAYVEALLALEDKRFWDHGGVDLIAIARAMVTNARRSRVVSGASTITMQVVRMAEPRPRTLRSKAVEAFRAIQIEQHYSKEEILDIYLRLLPFGQNYEGVETAAMVYFGHDASQLTPAQIATLLAVPQAPNARYPSPANEERLRNARNDIARRLLEQGALPRGVRSERLTLEQAIEAIEATPVPTAIYRMPREISHLAYQLRRQYPRARELTTPVDRSTQRMVEAMIYEHRPNIRSLGGEHIAVVVMDHQTGELRAAVGNFDFSSQEAGMSIPAYDVSRSTGSLLKPFLLARAIDLGVAAPSHRVVDIPVDYRGYRPENYDGTYDGLVRLDDALSRSLNVPFVNLLNQVGVDDFLVLMNRLGIPYSEDDADARGLSLVVGGIDATPMQVATMYSALARRGDPLEVQRLSSGLSRAMPRAPRAALSAESTWLVRDVLERRDRPDFAGRTALRDRRSPYAWKTGTSMGFRDAWTAGFGPRYVVVVWTGNLDYRTGRTLVGERAAAPLFFDIMEAVDPVRTANYEPPPRGLESVEVCSFSGHLPTGACEHTTHVDLPRTSIPTRPCPYHIEMDVDVATNLAVTPACRGEAQIETRTFVRLPSTVRQFFDIAGSGTPPPAYAPGCRTRGTGDGPSVVSPPAQARISLIPGLATDSQQVPLMASVEGHGPLSWFVNGRFIGQVDAGDRLWWEPRVGTHEIVVTDAHGRSARQQVVVE